MTTIAHVLSDTNENLWDFKLEDERKLKDAVDFMLSFIKDKSSWKQPKDVMYWEDWPMAQPSLIFANKKYQNEEYFENWKRFEHFPMVGEVIRNLPVRNPLIW